MSEQAAEYGEPRVYVGRVQADTTRWRLGEQMSGPNTLSTCRPMTLLSVQSEIVEVETTVRTRVVYRPGSTTGGDA